LEINEMVEKKTDNKVQEVKVIGANSKPKIVVLGAGAVGSLIGGLLAQAGEDVTLLARQAHVEAISAKGLHIEGVLGALTIPVKAVQALDFQPYLALLAVKTQDIETACRPISTYLVNTPIVTLQNGVRSDEMVASLLPKENIVSGVVMFNAQYLQPGQITYSRSGWLVIGEAFGENGQRVRDIQTLLNRAVRTQISDNIQGAHWTKLLVNNLANGLEAMTGLTIRECLRYPGLRNIGTLALKEGHQAIEKAGFRLAPLPGIPTKVLLFIIQSPLPVAAWVLSLSMGSLKTLSSTLQSLRRGRPTEIDYLNGEIVRLGQQVGLATPYNSKVVELVKEVEKSHQFFPPYEIVRRFSVS
jgi:2-dehydropantoate 2-reductase